MQNRTQDNRYEQLYSDMRDYALHLHERNKKRIRCGTIALLALPLILGLIRWLTDSDKILFLMLWVLCMFIICGYLIGVEYLDHSIQKKLKDLTDREEEFDGLLGIDESAAQITTMARERIEGLQEVKASAQKLAMQRMEDFYETRLTQLHKTGVLPDETETHTADSANAAPAFAQKREVQSDEAEKGGGR